MKCRRFATGFAGVTGLVLATGVAAAQPGIARTSADAPEPGATSAPPADPAERLAWLRRELDATLAAAAAPPSSTAPTPNPPPAPAAPALSAIVIEVESGRVLYARDDTRLLNAASNVKMVTSAAALSILGANFQWRTALATPARAGRWLDPGGVLPDDLVLRGSGDPSLSTTDLSEMAARLGALGVRRVRGRLLIDASLFADGSVAPAYDQKSESAAFRAPSSAASLNENAIAITIVPAAEPGAPARVILDPPSPYFVIEGRVATTARLPAVPRVDTGPADGGRTKVVLGGRVLAGAPPTTFYRRVENPELYLGHTLREILKKRGIAVDGGVAVGSLPGNDARILAAHASPPLALIVHDLNKRSSNFVAEQVLRRLGVEVVGPPGTWDKGLEATARYLEGAGIARGSYRMTNGAGLYDSNRFSARQIATVIRHAMLDFRIGGEFLSSLATAGADGTLAARMAGTAAERFVRAKTGSLATVSCLSGVAGAPGQKPLAFAFLMNDLADPRAARAAQDRAAQLLVGYLDPSRLSTAAPPAR